MSETLEQKYLRLKPEYTDWWAKATIDDSARARVTETVKKILQYRNTYEQLVKGMALPWWFVAVLHYRESSLDFTTHLHNGDKLSARTKNVPSGRPLLGQPPFTWVESALDALKMKDLHLLKDVSVPRLLFEAERYNGFGYRNRDDESVYVWSGTSMSDEKGKFVRDGVYDRSAPEKQLGIAALMLGLQEAGVAFTPVTTKKLTTTTEKVVVTTIGLGIPTVAGGFTDYLNWPTVALVTAALVVTANAGVFLWRKYRNV